jgi:hypothetical protein
MRDEVGDVNVDVSRAELERLHRGLTTLCLMEESEFSRVIEACLAGQADRVLRRPFEPGWYPSVA